MNPDHVHIHDDADQDDGAPEKGEFPIYLKVYEGEIYSGDGPGSSQPEYGGVWSALYIDMERVLRDGVDPMEVVDNHDSATFNLCDAVYQPDFSDVIHQPNFTKFSRQVHKLFDRALTSASLLIIDYIAVHERFRGQGIGRIALSKIIDAYKGRAGLVALETIPLQEGFQPYSVSMEPGTPFCIDFSDLDPDRTRSRAKLRRVFSELGFVRLGQTDYMLKALG